jgi:hypothetical protein
MACKRHFRVPISGRGLATARVQMSRPTRDQRLVHATCQSLSAAAARVSMVRLFNPDPTIDSTLLMSV